MRKVLRLTWRVAFTLAATVAILWATGDADSSVHAAGEPLSLVVTDPLAAPLSCPCVQGYAQRKYEVLAEYLTTRLGRTVNITFAESIGAALDKEGVDEVHLVIGKDSVIRAQGERLELDVAPLARLVGKDGRVTQTGLIVVRNADPAKTVADLAGYRIIYGPPDCDEKFAAARTLIEEAGVEVVAAKDAEISEACSDGACMIIDWGDKVRGAAVISSYAQPLLEGCGTIKKGDLRVVGETEPVPFITAFATKLLSEDEQADVQRALYAAGKEPGMLLALETLVGFVPLDYKFLEPKNRTATSTDAKPKASDAKEQAAAPDSTTTINSWPGWLGPTRNGRVGWLPHELPATPRIVWRRALARAGMGGLAVADDTVFVGDRDAANRADVFRALDAATGDERWTITYPTIGQLDYDNAPRATPLVHQGRVYFFGAFGDLTCADAATGAIVWRTNIRLKFLATAEMPWGTCSSPLAVDDMIIVNPGAPQASIVALDAATGKVRWQTPGEPQGYGSLIVATLGGVRQVVGHTQTKLCGWDPATGRELWSLQPRADGDFNVPTPSVIDGKLLVATENNGGRLYAFDDQGRINPDPVAFNPELRPQMSTPVAVGSRVFCVNERLDCFDASAGLKRAWRLNDAAFTEFGAVLASEDRVLAQGRGGQLLLIDSTGDRPAIVSRWPLTANEADRAVQLYTFPALVGTRLYARCEHEILCVDLAG
jgi:outer membrane protein assembly factor BamB/ABC-type phosphate/phosphonate transport system substrate-binding protein